MNIKLTSYNTDIPGCIYIAPETLAEFLLSSSQEYRNTVLERLAENRARETIYTSIQELKKEQRKEANQPDIEKEPLVKNKSDQCVEEKSDSCLKKKVKAYCINKKTRKYDEKYFSSIDEIVDYIIKQLH